MSSDEIAIGAEDLSKCYQIYGRPEDRLKQSIVPRVRRLLGQPARNYYREFWALRDVSFAIGKGETVGIIGRNGSGKSTLLQMICGTLTPTSGRVETSGRVAALLELGAGFNIEFTGRENVLLNAAIYGFPQHAILAAMDDILAFSELGDFLDQPVKTYSSGMYARLAFSIAIHVDPSILIVDETLSVGDARFVAKCLRRIRDIKDRGATILFVSHDVSTVRTLCDRAIWIDRGRIVEQGDVFPVTGEYMAFMFKDDDAAIAVRGHASAPDEPATVAAARAPSSAAVPATSAPAAGTLGGTLDPRPVTHWGSHPGTIVSAAVCDESGLKLDVCLWDSVIQVVIELAVPGTISRDDLCIAFSIKDLKGTDLIVSTTRDFDQRTLPEQSRFSVSFRMKNALVTGKYLLVAAVERRDHADIHYYEYVEGAHYFSSLSNERFFGLFQPPIEQQVRV